MPPLLTEVRIEASLELGHEQKPPVRPPERWWSNRLWQSLFVIGVVAAVVIGLLLVERSKTRSPRSVAQSSIVPMSSGGALRIKGTTQAMQSSAILVPQLAGEQVSTLTITRLIANGSRVKRGDLLAEFDRQAQLRDSIDKRALDSEQTASVVNAEAVEDAAKAKDETEIKVAEDDLSKARLEMQKVEILSRIDAEKAQETLDGAQATLAQLKETFGLKRKAAQASIRILAIQRERTRETMLHAEANAALMQIRSPIDGIVVLNSIYKGSGFAEVQEGDQVYPGHGFMQVVDPSTMEVQAPVNQQDFPGLKVGDKVRVHLDAYPDLSCPGELKAIDPMGQSGDFSSKVRQFTVVFALLCHDPRLMPGLSAGVDVDSPGSVAAGGSR